MDGFNKWIDEWTAFGEKNRTIRKDFIRYGSINPYNMQTRTLVCESKTSVKANHGVSAIEFRNR